ncbi:hypothetical protein DL765_000750 [Monosporascus sp. GIB2]|nr:hypothetical protein DL765_000750 [Monosporascus sp. GIB2]
MSDQACCPECGDSPLSIMGNITGILTFFYALLAPFLLFLTVVNTAGAELKVLRYNLDDISTYMEDVRGHFHILTLEADPDAWSMGTRLSIARDKLEDMSRKLSEELKEYETNPSTWTRIKWWHKYNEIAGKMARLQNGKDNFSPMLLNFLLRKARSQEKLLTVLGELIREMTQQGGPGTET